MRVFFKLDCAIYSIREFADSSTCTKCTKLSDRNFNSKLSKGSVSEIKESKGMGFEIASIYIDFNKTVLFRAKRPIAIELSAVILRQAGFP